MADAVAAQDAQANAAVIGAAITAAAFFLIMKPQLLTYLLQSSAAWKSALTQKLNSQPESAVQHAAQPVQFIESSATQAAHNQRAQQAELESDMSKFLSCSFGSHSEMRWSLTWCECQSAFLVLDAQHFDGLM